MPASDEPLTTGLKYPRKVRLSNAADFRSVFSRAQYKATRRDLLGLAIANRQNYPRLGLVVPKKHIRTAVERNRIKRLLRGSFRLNQKALAGLDIVILIRGGLDSQDNKTIVDHVESIWSDLVSKAESGHRN
ncbi:MAG: ribonuclease P protein component [Pseudohongiellaceae bacterium]